MTLKALRQEIRSAANPKVAEYTKRFFKTGKGEYGEGDAFLGIRVPVIRQLIKSHSSIAYQDFFYLLASKYHEERLAALIGLVNLFQPANEHDQKQIYHQYLENTRYINNWDLVDSSAYQIVGGYLFERSKKPLYNLVKSQCLWERRIAIIATFYFIKRDSFSDALQLSEQLLNDQEDLIHKAVGWMLREMGKRNHEIEEKFLRRHYQEMPRTMLRYAIEKFPEPLRQAFLKGEI